MEKSKILKDKAAMLYVLQKCGELGYLQLFKILYFANRSHLANYGRGIINDTFCALEKGPVPSTLFNAMKISKGEELKYAVENIELIANSVTVKKGFLVTSKEAPNMSLLSRSDVKELDKSIEENKDKSAEDLSELSHDMAWKKANALKKNSPMDILSIAAAGGANPDMIEYIREHTELDILLS